MKIVKKFDGDCLMIITNIFCLFCKLLLVTFHFTGYLYRIFSTIATMTLNINDLHLKVYFIDTNFDEHKTAITIVNQVSQQGNLL